MSEKMTKRYRRTIRKQKHKIVKAFVDSIGEYGLIERLKFVWLILTKRKKKGV